MVKTYQEVNREQREHEREEHHERKHRKYTLLIIMALLVAFVGIMLAQNALDIAEINNVYAPFPNNTNLAPDFSGIDPDVPVGTGERIQNITYTASQYPIELHVFAHAMSVSETAAVKAYIDGVLVSPRSGRPLGAAEQAYRGVDITIPKNSTYLVNITNYHHYEWREYPVLSGKNGTLGLNQTFITNGSSFNSTYDAYGSSKVNKSGDETITGPINITARVNISADFQARNVSIKDSGTQAILNTTTAKTLLLQSNAFPGLALRSSAGAVSGFTTIDSSGYIYPLQKTTCTGTSVGALCYNTTTNNLMLRNGTGWFNISLN